MLNLQYWKLFKLKSTVMPSIFGFGWTKIQDIMPIKISGPSVMQLMLGTAGYSFNQVS
jgi:hypothetical protein